MVGTYLQRCGNLHGILEIVAGKEKSPADVLFPDWNDLHKLEEISNRCSGRFPIPTLCDDVMECRQGMSGHEAFNKSALDCREKFRSGKIPGRPRQDDIEEDIDVEENPHSPYFSRR